MRVVAAWLDANRPPEAPLTLVHGDLQAPNILLQEDTGDFHLLDWELSRIGDPREDLGWWALAGKSQPPDLIDANPDAFYARYREQTGLSEEIVNPATVAYFTVLGSLAVFDCVLGRNRSHGEKPRPRDERRLHDQCHPVHARRVRRSHAHRRRLARGSQVITQPTIPRLLASIQAELTENVLPQLDDPATKVNVEMMTALLTP